MPQSDESKEQDELELLEENSDVPTGQDPDGTVDLGIPWENPKEPDQPTVKEYLKEKREKGEPRAGITKKVYDFSKVKKARKLAKKQRARNRRG